MSKHTKGPWESRGKYIYTTGDIAKLIAEAPVYSDMYTATTEERNCNVNLIAAAPEMLEALRMVSLHMDRFQDCSIETMEIINNLLARIGGN